MSKRKPSRKPSPVKLIVEHLEARCLLTTYYTLTFLGGFGGTSRAYAVNSSGQVVGFSYDQLNTERAFIWDSTNGLQNLAPGYVADAFGINDSGQAVGGDDSLDDAVIWDTVNGTKQHLGFLTGGTYSNAAAISPQGYVVGFSEIVEGNSSFAHAFLWDPTSQNMNDLGTLGGDSASYAYGINDAGEAVGISESGGEVGTYHAFLWTPDTGGMVNLVPGATNSGAYAINSSGQVVGFADGKAFLWTPDVPNGTTGTISYLNNCNPSGPRATVAYGVNDSGQVVGVGDGGGIVWDSTNCTQVITSLVMPSTNFSMADALGINNSGQIVGFGGYLPSGPGGSVLFTPIPGSTGKGSRPAPFARSEIGQVLGSLSHAHSPIDLDGLFSSFNREDFSQIRLSQNVSAVNDGIPPQHSIPLGLSHLAQAKHPGLQGQETGDNPMDLLAAREAIRLE